MYAERIRFYRKQKGLSQAEMADNLHMSPAAYSKIETHRTSLSTDTLQRIAEVLHISPMAILEEQRSITPSNDNADIHPFVNRTANAENVFTNQKELFEKIIQAKDAEIKTLKLTGENLQNVLQHQTTTIAKLSGGQ